MKVHVHPVPALMSLDVYVESGRDDSGSTAWFLDSRGDAHPVRTGDEAPRFMRIREDVANALVMALYPTDEPPSVKHLALAEDQLDRMTKLVERAMEYAMAPPVVVNQLREVGS